jgi:hypothetical protein
MDNLNEIWEEINSTIDSYVNEDMSFKHAKESIDNINKNNTLGIKINLDELLGSLENYNEDGIISYEEEPSYYDDDDYLNSSYDDDGEIK